MRKLLILIVLSFAVALGMAATAAPAQVVPATERAKRLFLKDGSYQLASKWEIKGERVRYYSTERSAWEEIPNSLIDWKATEAYNAQKHSRPAVTSDEVASILAEEEKARREEQARTQEAAPGLNLPAAGGVFMLDRYQSENQLVEVVQNGSDLKKNTALDALKAAINPLSLSVKQSMELKGPNARVQAHTAQPILFVNLTPQVQGPEDEAEKDDNPLALTERYLIVRARKKGQNRQVGNLKVNITGKMTEQRDVVPATAQPIGGGWVKVTPTGTLEPGEYALIEMLGPNQMNMFVWDFGVNPAAPPNTAAWKATQPDPSRTGTNQRPSLTPRKR